MVRALVAVALIAAAGCAATKRNPIAGAGGEAEAGGAGGAEPNGVGAAGENWPVLGDSAAEACIAFELAACLRREACGLPPSWDCLLETRWCPDSAFSPGSTLTADGLKACAESWADLSCQQVRTGVLPDCFTLGTRKVAEDCWYGSQCESGYCELADNCGACAPPPEPDEPDPSLPVEGELCVVEVGCRRPLYCAGPTLESSTCIALSRSGERCGGVNMCEAGLYCSSQSQCVELPGENEPCGVAGLPPEQYMACAQWLECNESVSPAVCVTAGSVGKRCRFSETCGQGQLCGCIGGAETCESSNCLIARYAGESCAGTDSLCHPAFACEGGVCTPRELQGHYANNCVP